MHPAAALRVWLRHAAAAYGDDLPVAPARALRVPPPLEPPRAAEPEPAPAATPSTHAPAGSDLPLDLDELRRVVTPCRRCKLCENRTQVVFGEGSPTARVMFVGEAPGAREDEQGRPFVGPAGRLLTRIIENAMGFRRADVYIANVNKCRPPNNRNPEPDEIAACLPYLRAQIRAIRPEVIVAMGRVAAQNLLGTSLSMSRLRGRDLQYEGVPVVATWHPAYLLRQPSAKRETWEDIKRVNAMLGLPEVPPRPDRGS